MVLWGISAWVPKLAHPGRAHQLGFILLVLTWAISWELRVWPAGAALAWPDLSWRSNPALLPAAIADGSGILGVMMAFGLLSLFGWPGAWTLLPASGLVGIILVVEQSWLPGALARFLRLAQQLGRWGGEKARQFQDWLVGWREGRRRQAWQRGVARGVAGGTRDAAGQTQAGLAGWHRDRVTISGDEVGSGMARGGTVGGVGGQEREGQDVSPWPADTSEPGRSLTSKGSETRRETAAGERSSSHPQPVPAGRQVRGQHGIPTAGHFVLPDAVLLSRPARRRRAGQVPDQSALLEETFRTFGIQASVLEVHRGPTVTRYELQPAPGVKVSRITHLADDIALALAATGVRIEAPIPGKRAIGIEVPNPEPETVFFRDVIESDLFRLHPSPLALALGKDIAGEPVVADLRKMIHLLIAGATGSGKSVCLNALIASLLYKSTPQQVRLLMIDPKRVELTTFDGVPHLICPVITDPKEAAGALRWAVREMEERYQLFAQIGARNIEGYNAAIDRLPMPRPVIESAAAAGAAARAGGAPNPEAQSSKAATPAAPLPYVVVIIDELADLMLVAAAEVEDAIWRLAQMARAAGIHLVIATQRPSVDVITGVIKANIPSRIAFAVSSQTDSRVILDMLGAERLLGRGDMLFFPIGAAKPVRAQGALILDPDVERLVDFWKRQGTPEYEASVWEPVADGENGPNEDTPEDSLFEDAVNLVTEMGQASISLLQRRFRIGYSRAARLIDQMEQKGIVGPAQGAKPREILIGQRLGRGERSLDS
ncbi:MAG: DNA translocase FtsK [Limnochordaceae bacterium]|nr:DNA translocase FtsK [Limnochordaceae bacterium]